MKKSLKFIILIFLFFVIIILVGITYGFYEMVIIGNTNNHSANVNSKKLSVNYTDGTAKMNFKGDYLFPGDTAEKTFTVQNTGDSSANYSIILDNVTNTFTRIQDLRYYLYINNTLVDEGAINNDEMQYLYYKENLAVNSSDSVKFVFKYAETDEVQNEDMNKNLSFRVNIVGDVKTNVNSENNNVVVNLNNSDTLSSYRIYGNSIQDGTPSPSNPVEIENVGDLITDTTDTNYGKYKIPVTVSGKNLFDYENVPFGTNTKTGNGYSRQGYIFLTTYYTLEEYLGQTVTISFDLTVTEDGTFLIYEYQYNGIGIDFRDIQKTMIANTKERISITGEVKQLNNNPSYTDGSIIIYKNADYTGTLKIENIQFELGSTATEYEPYIEPTTTNIYLDEPLRKVGNYADYIDLKEQKIVRNIYEFVMEDQDYNWENWGRVQNYGYRLKIDVPNLKSELNTDQISNYFQTNYVNAYDGIHGYFRINSSKYINLAVDSSVTTSLDSSKINSWFRSKAADGNPVKFNIAMEQEIIKNNNIPALSLHNGTNIIKVGTSTSPSKIELEYYKK